MPNLELRDKFPEIKCPICGGNDVEFLCVDMTGNYYHCKSTGRVLSMMWKVEMYFEESIFENYILEKMK
jgi:hypothetical protein